MRREYFSLNHLARESIFQNSFNDYLISHQSTVNYNLDMIMSGRARSDWSHSQSPSSVGSNFQVSSPVKLTSVVVASVNIIITYIVVVHFDMINSTMDNYRLFFTDHRFFKIPLVVLSLLQLGIIISEVLSNTTWSLTSYYWYICQTMCQIFWILTFSSNAKQSNSTSLLIAFFILYCSVKLFRSLYQPPPNQTYYYFERNIVSLFVGYFLVMFLVNFGIVMVFDQILKQQHFVKVFFISLPVLALLIQFLIQIRGHEEKQDYLGIFGYWFGIVYSLLISTNNYLYNQLFTYHQPYHS